VAKLGTIQPPLTFSQLTNDFDLDTFKSQAMPLPTCSPYLFKSKTADAAHFTEINAYMSATNAQAPKGNDALGRFGRNVLPSKI